MNGVIGAGVILSVMGGGVFYNVLAAPNAWPDRYAPHHPSGVRHAFGWLGQPLFVCAGTEWLVPKSPVAFHSLGLLPVCIQSRIAPVRMKGSRMNGVLAMPAPFHLCRGVPDACWLVTGVWATRGMGVARDSASAHANPMAGASVVALFTLFVSPRHKVFTTIIA